MFKKLIFSSSFFLFSNSALALDLNEALTSAYETNPQLKSIQEEYLKSIEQFPQTLGEEFLPTISASSNSTKNKSTPLSPLTKKVSERDSYRRSIDIKQNIFNGGSSVSRLAAVNYGVLSAKINYLTKEQDFLAKSIESYIDLILASEKVEAAKAFVSSAQKEYEATEERLKVGEATRTEVASTKAQWSQALFNESSAKAELEVRRNTFRIYFNKEPEDLTFPIVPTDLPQDFETFKNLALQYNLNLKLANYQMNAAKNSVRAKKGNLLPTVDAQASLERNYFDRQEDSRINGKNYSTTLSVNIPIFSQGGAEYAKIRAAKSELRKAAYDLDSTKTNFSASLIQAWESYQSAQKSVIFAEEAVRANELAYQGMKSSYEVGHKTILDVLKAEKDLFDTKIQNINARKNLIKSAYEVKSTIAGLTGEKLGLKTKLFNPEHEFKKVKFKIVGF